MTNLLERSKLPGLASRCINVRSWIVLLVCLLALLAVETRWPVLALPPTPDSHLTGVDERQISRQVLAPLLPQLAHGTFLDMEPPEERFGVGATDAFKALRRGLRRVMRFFQWSAARWAKWLLRSTIFLALAIAAPLIDRELVSTWRDKGWRGVRRSILLGAAVHVRLLLDRRAPLLGKLAIVLALGYGVISSDLVPDKSFPIGALDDLLAIILASRGFMLLCPQGLIEAHAVRAASSHGRRRRWQRTRILPPTS